MERPLNYGDLCEYLQVSYHTLRKWVRRRQIPHVRLPNGGIRFYVCSVDAWLQTQAKAPAEHQGVVADHADADRHAAAG